MARKKDPLAAAMAILAKHSIELDTPLEMPEANYNHVNAVAMFAREPKYFVMGVCGNCKQKFAHNQPIPAGTRVGYCSDGCRKIAFKKSTGVDWGRVVTGKEPWDGDAPMIITPEQLKNLEAMTEWFSRNRTTLVIQPLEQSLTHDQDEYSPSELDGPEDFQSPTNLRDYETAENWGDASVYEPENQHQVVAHTNLLERHDPSVFEQTVPEDDPFDF